MPAVVALALVAMALTGTADFVYRRAARAGAAASSFMVVQSWFFGPTAIVFGLVTGALVWHPALALGPVAGVLLFAATRSFLQSLRQGDPGVNTTLYRLSFVVTVALAIVFLGEPLTRPKALGFALAASSVVLLGGAGARAVRRERAAPVGALALALAAMVALGLVAFLYKIAALHGATAPAFIVSQFCAFTLVALGHSLWWERRLRLDRAVWTHAPFAGVLLSTGLIVLILALERGEASVAVPIAQMSFVVTAALNAAVERARPGGRVLAGFAAAVLTVLAFSR